MEMDWVNGILRFDSFLPSPSGYLVLFVGRQLNNVFRPLKEFSIPEPVTGGILFSVIIAISLQRVSDVAIEFDLVARDVLLVYFFTTIGINASLKDLLKGGLPLVILLAITIGYMMVQNFTGIGVAKAFGLDSPVGMLGGSVSL